MDIPAELAETQVRLRGAEGRAFVAALPGRAADFLERWELRPAGPPMYGMCALVLPVERVRDGTRAVLKLQDVDEETAGEPLALRAWDGAGAVRLLAYEEETGTLLLERLDSARDLSQVGIRDAVRILAELLGRLTAVEAPPGLRRLGEVTARMLDRAPAVLSTVADEDERRLLRDCAAAVREVAAEPGNRLLHWDLHYENVLSAVREPGGGPGRDPGRESWLAIDPKPLAGDPGFELLPALHNRFTAGDVRWRFDLMTEVLDLDRERARAWTLGRVLQNGLWRHTAGPGAMSRDQAVIARTLLS
ncbi:aminoglycoside phosphotransferase family protein [Streptomyces sp. NPDC088725]|uniref:aminoglycoside phosphotransferase family protein n=1 Tax=Streptomyces sp. NPDC088725 TaxID=3365873 RepID=UPI0037FF4D34